PANFHPQACNAVTYIKLAITSAVASTHKVRSTHNESVAGTTYTDTFDVVSADGTHTSVTINILGTNDAAILSADTRNLTETNSEIGRASCRVMSVSTVGSQDCVVSEGGPADES